MRPVMRCRVHIHTLIATTYGRLCGGIAGVCVHGGRGPPTGEQAETATRRAAHLEGLVETQRQHMLHM